jgi:transcriptional regulator with XRE-family HTH domain
MTSTGEGLRFPAELRQARRAAGLSYRALASRCGLSHSFLSHLEKGERRAPRLDRVVALAEALGATPRSFLLAALADRVGHDVAELVAALLRQAEPGRQIDPTGGGMAIESGPPAGAEWLRELTAADDAAEVLRRRLYFVDLQFDAEILRTAFEAPGVEEPIVLGLVGGGVENGRR